VYDHVKSQRIVQGAAPRPASPTSLGDEPSGEEIGL
jgi:hypothetical protein